MSLLTTDEARALVTTSLDDDDLQSVIDREESWLTRRIGPLTGERVETFVTEDGDEVLRLTRHTASVSVEDDHGVYLDAELRGWSDLIPDSADSWSGDVRVTYTPDDEDEVKRSIVTLVRLTVHESAYAAESAGGYSAQVDLHAQRTMRYSAWRTLLRPRRPTTTRLTSAIPSGGRSLAAVQTEASGS